MILVELEIDTILQWNKLRCILRQWYCGSNSVCELNMSTDTLNLSRVPKLPWPSIPFLITYNLQCFAVLQIRKQANLKWCMKFVFWCEYVEKVCQIACCLTHYMYVYYYFDKMKLKWNKKLMPPIWNLQEYLWVIRVNTLFNHYKSVIVRHGSQYYIKNTNL